jgi:hypothetical protein
MHDVDLSITEQSSHLLDLAPASSGLQLMDDSTRGADFVREPANVSHRQEFWQAIGAIVVSRQIRQDSFQSTRLERQTDVADAQRSRRRLGRLADVRQWFGNSHSIIPQISRQVI